MEKTTKRMIMRVQGEGITRIAREQCYINHRFGHAMEILQGSLQTDQLDNNEIAGLAFAVLDGRAEIKGVYPDGDYRFEYNEEPDKRWRIEKLISKLAEKAEESEAQLRDIQQKYLFLLDRMEDWEKRAANDEYFEEYEERLFKDVEARRESRGSSMLDSFLKRMSDKEEHTTEDYGWLEPNGTFHGVEWGEHTKWADKWLRKNLPEEEYEKTEKRFRLGTGGDALVERGWILLHNPSCGIAYPTEKEGGHRTKEQKEFLYDYYMERQCHKEANAVWKDGDE